MFTKFPFNRTSKQDATLDDVNAIFKATGWQALEIL